MPDCENVKFCGTHGTVLGDDRICPQCAVRDKNWYARPEGWVDGLKTNYFVDELAKRNRTPWVEERWVQAAPSQMTTVYLCDTCRHFMHHQLNYCPTCGGRYRQEKLTYKDLAAKYVDYRQGF